MVDQTTLAYVNMYAVLGALENLCDLDDEARSIVDWTRPVSVGFKVKEGPEATLCFDAGKCTLVDGVEKCTVLLPFSSPEKFNALIDGTGKAVPSKGFTNIGFLLKSFTPLTDRLTEVLRPTEEAMKDPEFFALNTKLTFYVVASSISQLGNHDKVSLFSASNVLDGEVQMSIKDGPAATIVAKDHVLKTIKAPAAHPRAIMEFGSIEIANALFNDKVNSFACIANGTIRMGGMINVLDNVNRIMDRVALYLA